MILALIALLFFAAASVALVARAVAMPRVRAAETMGQIGSYGYTRRGREGEADSGAVRGALDDIAGFVGGLVESKLRGVKEAELRNELMSGFIPVADEVHRLQTGEDRECRLFQKIAEQGHYAGRTQPTARPGFTSSPRRSSSAIGSSVPSASRRRGSGSRWSRPFPRCLPCSAPSSRCGRDGSRR